MRYNFNIVPTLYFLLWDVITELAWKSGIVLGNIKIRCIDQALFMVPIDSSDISLTLLWRHLSEQIQDFQENVPEATRSRNDQLPQFAHDSTVWCMATSHNSAEHCHGFSACMTCPDQRCWQPLSYCRPWRGGQSRPLEERAFRRRTHQPGCAKEVLASMREIDADHGGITETGERVQRGAMRALSREWVSKSGREALRSCRSSKIRDAHRHSKLDRLMKCIQIWAASQNWKTTNDEFRHFFECTDVMNFFSSHISHLELHVFEQPFTGDLTLRLFKRRQNILHWFS
jgi:hypothetical protein